MMYKLPIPAERGTSKRLDVSPEHQGAHESMLEVGRLIEAERDGRRAQVALDQLYSHKSYVLTLLHQSAEVTFKSARVMLGLTLLFLAGLGLGGVIMHLAK